MSDENKYGFGICRDESQPSENLNGNAESELAAPAGYAVSITGLQALLHCELWARSDMNMAEDKRAYEHRLNVIRQGIAQLERNQHNDAHQQPPPTTRK